MTSSSDNKDQLAGLLRGLADDTLTSDDRTQLAALLRDDVNARKAYYKHVKLTALLRREGRRDAAMRDIFPEGIHQPADQEVGVALSSHSGGLQRKSRMRNWLPMLGAAVLIAVGFLSVGEATGITQIVPTVIRIVTGEGALVIEVDDPTVSVSLDGEDVTITGAGIHELRLKPGTHKFRATKDGQALYEEVVTIERGGRKIVNVRREQSAIVHLDRLTDAESRFAEAGRLYAIGQALLQTDPWEPETPLRKSLVLYDQLVVEFPDVPKHYAPRHLCRFMLATTLARQSLRLFQRSTNLSAEDAGRAVAAAREATELLPNEPGMFTQLGRAYYRARDWNAALAALEKGPQEQDYNGSQNRFCLAMAHWQLGHKQVAREFYDEAAQWMKTNAQNDGSMRGHRSEAAELLGLNPDAPPGDEPKEHSE